MATSNSPTRGQSNSPRQDGVDYGFRGVFDLAVLDFLLIGCLASEARQAEGSVGERWSSHGPRRGRPQAWPVGGWLVHRGRELAGLRRSLCALAGSGLLGQLIGLLAGRSWAVGGAERQA
jgi:hypothetical protein